MFEKDTNFFLFLFLSFIFKPNGGKRCCVLVLKMALSLDNQHRVEKLI